MCKHMAEKADFRDAKNHNFSEQMEFQKKSIVLKLKFQSIFGAFWANFHFLFVGGYTNSKK